MKVLLKVTLSSLLFACACAEAPPGQRDAPGETGAIRFSERSDEAGLGEFVHVTGAYGAKLFPETMGSGVAFIDYDDDGDQDLLLVGGANWPGRGDPVRALWLFRNDGSGTFDDVTDEAGLGGVHAYGFGLAVADYDADGDRDFYLTTVFRNLLFRNEGGRFTEAGLSAGVAGGDEWSTSTAFFHADGDGLPDLYVANYVPWSVETDKFCSVDGKTKSYCTPLAYEGIPGRYFHNNGDGTFSDWTSQSVFENGSGRSLGVLPFDYDEDGWTDLMVTNDALRDLLYHGNGDGSFTEVGLLAGVAFDERGRARAGMGIDAGVVDTTGRVSVFIGNFSNEQLGVYRYGSNGMFEERSAMSRIGSASVPTLTFGLLLLDADMDGDLDLFAANGHVQDDIEREGGHITYRQPPHLFVNDGNGTFHDAVTGMTTPLATPSVARGVASADIDFDGDVDLVVTENGGAVRLFRNDAPPRNFLQLHLTSGHGDPDGLGAHARIYYHGRSQERFVRTSHSYLSGSEPVLTFGLGTVEHVDSVSVTWVGGETEVWRDLKPNQRYRLAARDPVPRLVAR